MKSECRIKILLIDPGRRLSSLLLGCLTALPVEMVGMLTQLPKAGEQVKALNPDLVLVEWKAAQLVEELHSSEWARVFPDPPVDRGIKLQGSGRDLVVDQLFQLLRETDSVPVEVYRSSHSPQLDEDSSPLLPLPTMGIMPLPTLTGLRFFPVKQIVLFRFEKGGNSEKGGWMVLLSNFSRVRLRGNTRAKDILGLKESLYFVSISPSLIVNLTFIEQIGYKSRLCRLISPFDQITLTVSRTQLSKLRERFDFI